MSIATICNVWSMSESTGSARLVLCAIAHLSGADDEAVCSLSRLSDLTKLAEVEVEEAIVSLLCLKEISCCPAEYDLTRFRVLLNPEIPEDVFEIMGTRKVSGRWQSLRRVVFERDDYVCQYCGVRCEEPNCDHVMPRSRGGADELSNLVTSCRACNNAKGAKTPEEWRR